MTKAAHNIYIGILTVIVVCTVAALAVYGSSYYTVALTERMYHAGHVSLKPSGTIGHGLGIFGSLLMITGIVSYMARKRFRFLSRIGQLKYWLEFHIFLCTIGPLLILFHTAFKFGGIVAVSFWCMVAVFLSGIVGRFIYLQIPRSIEGRELSLTEIREMKKNIAAEISRRENITEEYKNMLKLVKQDKALSRKISRLDTMQRLFRYWHVVHLPFALIMLIIMAIHIFITVLFGYRWIF